MGADMWEVDVGMTADSELIVLHDDTLDRTSNATEMYPDRKPWLARDFTLDELRRLDFGSWFMEKDPFGQVSAGKIAQHELASYAGEPVLTLTDALQFTLRHDWYVNIEIKGLTVVEEVVHLVGKLGAADNVIISSFNPTCLKRVNRANPYVSTGLLVDTPQNDPVELLKEVKARAYHPRIHDLTPLDVAFLQAHGFEVRVWVVNDEEDMRTLISLGVDGIFTDFPQRLHCIQLNASHS